ncbi:efflux transporter, RND family, MFP subunit [Methylobacterium sp. 4-46]|uniref:efflux RND transporter periplasmic adaptor subunit n=1 Tax=unclassified Methylobacterium TaxID=2615210 RepID=UPI000152E8BA|nr:MULTISPECIES: efflux RND transporter periplasmic adaptor subunit [Methylobacterium]ACA15467.1 efflux transporter, RND family, MFP subunit [Methylobacterium sp. 4-46]WFT81185.1 efflux RND transporter periplasmic adaptor subunit [Methylobacterium nodulans]
MSRRPIHRLPRRAAPALAALLWAALAGPVAAETAPSAGLAVSVAPAKRRCFDDRVDVTGVLAARQEVQIRPERDGLRVQQVAVRPLDEVRQNQVLAQLVPDDGSVNPTPIPIRAPVAGVVGRSTATIGGPAPAHSDPLFVIIGQGEIELAADAPITALGKIAPGQPVTVKPLGLGPISGRVRLVSPSTDAASQLGQVRILLSAIGEARLGMYARGTVSVGESCGIAVPFSSLVSGQDGTTVYVVSQNHIEARPVAVGLFSEDEVEIRSGLSENDLVVVRAAPFVREGDLVRPIRVGEGQALN